MIKAVIFDIDGVLIDSFEANYVFFKRFTEAIGYFGLTKKEYKKYFHLTVYNTVKAITKISNDAEIKKIADPVYHRVEYPLKLLKAPLDTNKVIKKLSKLYKLALVTSRMEKGVKNYLLFSGLKSYFKTIVHFGHYKNPKPHPEPLLVALKKLKVKPNQTVYIGDALTDMQAAKAAGVKFILFSKNHIKGAKIRTSQFKHLPNLISELA